MNLNRIRGRIVVAMLLAFALIAPTVAPTLARQTETNAADVVEQVGPAVVTVINIQVVEGLFQNPGAGQEREFGAGTGFIIDDQGHIVTNWHVVTGGTSFLVVLSDGTEIEAQLIAEDPRNDLAVIRIDPALVPAVVSFGDSDALRPGQPVLAIGSPLGELGNTVTQGIVSALNRDQLSTGQFCLNYTNLIQHDAAINPGNSGGPLFNLQGEVIGVNTLGIPTGPGGQTVQGLFFAVPSNIVAVVSQQMIETGDIAPPYVGIQYTQITPPLSAANDLPVDYGLFLSDVLPNTPAAAAGLQPNDIITGVDGVVLEGNLSLGDVLLNRLPGDTIQLTVLRGGEQIQVPLTIGQLPAEELEACVLPQ